jgi:hypothetical protein
MNSFIAINKKGTLDKAVDLGLDKEDVEDILASLVAITQIVDEKDEEKWFEIRDMLHALKGDLTALIPFDIIENVCYEIEEFMLCDATPSHFPRYWCETRKEIENLVGIQVPNVSDVYNSTITKEINDESNELALDKEDIDDISASLIAITQTVDENGERAWFAIRDMLHALKGDLTALIPFKNIENICYKIEEFMLCDFIPYEFHKNWHHLQNEIQGLIGNNGLTAYSKEFESSSFTQDKKGAFDFELDKEYIDDIFISLGGISRAINKVSDSSWNEIRDMLHALRGDLAALIPQNLIENVNNKIEEFMMYDETPEGFPSEWREMEKVIVNLITK